MGYLKAIRRPLAAAGMGIALLGFVILGYYLVVTGWTLGYLVSVPAGLNTDFDNFSESWKSLGFFLGALATCCGIVLLGVRNGIEAAAKILLPLLIVIVVGLMGYSLTTSGRREALDFLFSPDPGALLEAGTWANAFGQAFFSLGVGMGVLITYGSYRRDKGSLLGSGAIIAGADSIIALMAGMVVFPLVFSYGFAPEAGAGLTFQTLPIVFDRLQGGVFLGTIFYLLLFIAATTSAISILEMVVKALSEGFGWSRRRAMWSVVGPMAALGTLTALSFSPVGLRLWDRTLLDILDKGAGTYGILVGGLITSVALFWLSKPEELIGEVGSGMPQVVVKMGFWLGRWVTPPALVVTLAAVALGTTGGG